MKKTLLCFLFLFTTAFYAQVTHITTCAGVSFDLNSLKRDFIGNLNPAETTVTYFLSVDDALNNTNVISNPTNYIAPAGVTEIFGRIDNNGTITTNYFELTAISAYTLTASHKPILCKGETTSLSINAAGGNGSYLYSINNSAYTSTDYYNNLPAGVYTIKVQNPNPICSETTINYTITEPNALTVTSMVVNPNTIITASGGTAPYQYSLDGMNFQPGNIFPNLSAGSHLIWARDSEGCAASVMVNVDSNLISTANLLKQIDCFSNASIIVTAFGGHEPYTYSINGGDYNSSSIFENLSAGTYYITVRDAVNITSNTNAIVVNPLVPVTATPTVIPMDCFNNAIIKVQAAGGQSPYTYSIDGGITYTSNNTFTNAFSDTYKITVKDNNGCVSPIAPVTIEDFVPLVVTASNTSLLCYDDKASLTINVSGGKAPYQYSVNNSVYTTNNTFTELKAGTYTIKVKDATCSLSELIHVITEPKMVIGDMEIEGQTISITNVTGGTGIYQYAINNDIFQNNNVFTNLKPGIHTIKLRDSNNCQYFIFHGAIADENTLVSTAAITKQLDCNGNAQITVTAKGGKAPYLYSIDGGITYQDSNIFNNLSAGKYDINVKDITPDVSDVNIIVINPLVNLTATATNTPIICRSDLVALTITASGGQAPYQYSLNEGIYTTNNQFTDIKAGTYTIKVKDASGCIFALPYTITEPAKMIGRLILEGQTATIKDVIGGSGSYLYSLNSNELQTSNVFTNVKGEFNMISVYDSLGCFGFGFSFSVKDPNLLTSSVTITKPIDCNRNAEIKITATGGQAPYNYSIDGGVTYQKNNIFSNLIAGNYTLTVKDTINNTSTNNLLIAAYSPLITSWTQRNVTCSGSSDGSVHVEATGGIAPYSYSLNNSIFSTSNVFNNLPAGEHMLTVKDAADCLSTFALKILQPNVILFTANVTNATNDNNGEITTLATGGVPPYNYAVTDNFGLQIIPFQISNVFGGLKAGSYGIQVRDANGCITSQTNVVIANKPNTLLATTSVTPATCLNPTGTITITATGGIVPYQYSSDNGVTYVSSNIFTNLTPGTYAIAVRDAENNITSVKTEITTANGPAVAATVISNVLCKGFNNGSITAVATGGKAPYTYSLNNSTFSDANTFSNLRVGSFTITAKDFNGCLATTTILLTEPAEDLSATVFAVNDQSIIVNAKGGTAPYLYFLQNKNGIVVAGPQDNGVFVRLPLGLYSAQVTDANECGYIHFGVNVIPAAALSATVDVTSMNCTDPGTITVNASGGFQPYQYSYNNGSTYTNSNVYSSFTPGSYAIKVRDYYNTIVSLTAVITRESEPLKINLITITDVLCKGSAQGTITLQGSGGRTPYSYSLDNGVYSTDNSGNGKIYTNLLAGVHSITMLDVKGCVVTKSVTISEPTSPLISGITVQNQTITMEASGGTAGYKYSLSPDLDNFSEKNIFPNLTPGKYTTRLIDTNGCTVTMNVLVDPPAPLIEGKNKFVIEFAPGQTLADIIVNGQNIRWYMNYNITDGSTGKKAETSLPLTTVLVDGTTYYASQTIDGIESKERLAVTAKSNGALSTSDFVLPNFKYYPNPVKHILTISNSEVIDQVEIYTVTGKTLLDKKINNVFSEIDLSNFSSGLYLLKVKSEGRVKTIKILKK